MQLSKYGFILCLLFSPNLTWAFISLDFSADRVSFQLAVINNLYSENSPTDQIISGTRLTIQTRNYLVVALETGEVGSPASAYKGALIGLGVGPWHDSADGWSPIARYYGLGIRQSDQVDSLPVVELELGADLKVYEAFRLYLSMGLSGPGVLLPGLFSGSADSQQLLSGTKINLYFGASFDF